MKYQLIRDASNIHGTGIFATAKFSPGDTVVPFPFTLEVNHSCSPNVFQGAGYLGMPCLVAIEPISPKDEITVFYGFNPGNEVCKCNGEHCSGSVGFHDAAALRIAIQHCERHKLPSQAQMLRDSAYHLKPKKFR